MKVRRSIAIFLTIAMLISIVPTAVFAAGAGAPEDYGIKMVGEETTYSNGKSGIIFDILAEGNEHDILTIALALSYDNKVLSVSSTAGMAVPTDSNLTPWLQMQPLEVMWGESFTSTVSGRKVLSDARDGLLLNMSGATNGAQEFGAYTSMAKLYFVFNDGYGLSDLASDTVSLASKDQIGSSAVISAEDLIMIGNGETTYSYGTVNSSKEDQLNESQFAIEYPRSTAESAITLKANDTVTVAEDGTITLAAPEKGKQYTAETALALAEVAGLDTSVTPAETESFDTTGAILTKDGVTFSIDADGNVTTDVEVPGSFTGGEATINVNVTGGNGDYSKAIKVQIPEAVLPPHELSPASGSLLDQETKWKASTALAEFFTGEGDWELLTDTNKADVEGCEYTPVDDTAELSATGGTNSDGVYEIPVFKAKVAEQNRATAALFKLTIVGVPTADNAEDLVTAESAYTSTTNSITFTKATNPAWEYAVVKESDAATADLTTLTYTAGDAENGVTINDLDSGTSYVLVVRVKATDKYDASTPVKATTPAVTKYDLRVDKAYLKTDTDETDTIVPDSDPVMVSAMTAGPVTSENVGNYVQVITLTNTNGNSIYNVAANVYNVGTETANTDFTAAINGAAAEVAPNGTITIEVTPNSTVSRGVHTADLVITADNAESGGTQVVKKTIRVELTVYGNRDGEATVSDITLRPATSTDTTYPKAAANTAIKLGAVWGSEAADSYELVVTAKAGEPLELAGYGFAWSGTDLIAPLATISFSLDYGATWHDVPIPEGADPYQWSTFTATWTPQAPGTYMALVKATNADGFEQEQPSGLFVVVEE